MHRFTLPILAALVAAIPALPQPPKVGPANGGIVVPTGQLVRPAGEVVRFSGRPVDIVLSPDGKTAFAKDNRGLVMIDAATWKVTQELPFPKTKDGGGSMHGIAVSKDGTRVFATTANDKLHIAEKTGDKWTIAKSIKLPGPKEKDASHPTGIALFADGKRALVCLSRNNAVAVVDLQAGKIIDTIAVGIAPYAVVLNADESTAYVSNWGGRRPKTGDHTGVSSGTDVVIDERGIGASGTVGAIDLTQKKMTAEVAVGLHPAGLRWPPTASDSSSPTRTRIRSA